MNRIISIFILLFILVINIILSQFVTIREGASDRVQDITIYDDKNLDITYHETADQLQKRSDMFGSTSGTAYVPNPTVTVNVPSQSSTNGDITVSSVDGISIGSKILSSTASGINPGTNVVSIDSTKPVIRLNTPNLSVNAGTITLSRIDGQGNLVALTPIAGPQSITYYGPDKFRFGASSYVPTYDDAVYLSKTTGQSQPGKINNPAYALSGICSYYKNDPFGLENACNLTDPNTCASTSCCVLMGGNACVSGNKHGAIFPKNFTSNFYFYQGQCYGNCQ